MDELEKDIVTDFDMPSWRKAGFTIKREVAAVPGGLLLVIAGIILAGILGKIILQL